ncbi:MAG TPA: hypothetical protein VH170_03610 [Chthoniobacterales bacterium]|jgi:hypothetical protein|nr:hypothetical protein [Chthoniobacterales bacterium]
MQLKLTLAILILLVGWSAFARTRPQPRVIERVVPLPLALSDDFEFRKRKLYSLTETAPGQEKTTGNDQVIQSATKGGKLASTAPSSKSTTVQDASLRFEREYRLFGAVTKLDQHERVGNYFDFFWKAKRTADLTVRLEYRQEKLHAHVQAQEVFYPSARGSHKTEFKVVGDDYFDDGRVTAWRCCIVENGRIVAETHSYMWE